MPVRCVTGCVVFPFVRCLMQPACRNAMLHRAVFQNRQIKPPAIEADQSGIKLSAIGKEPVYKILFLGCQIPAGPQFFDLVHFKITIALDGCTQKTDRNNLVKRLTGEPIATAGDFQMIIFEHLPSGFRIRCRFTGQLRQNINVGNGFNIKDEQTGMHHHGPHRFVLPTITASRPDFTGISA